MTEACFQRTSSRKGLWGIMWSRDWWRHVTPKGQTRDRNTLRPNISKTAGDAI